jgi:hypothetical protein
MSEIGRSRPIPCRKRMASRKLLLPDAFAPTRRVSGESSTDSSVKLLKSLNRIERNMDGVFDSPRGPSPGADPTVPGVAQRSFVRRVMLPEELDASALQDVAPPPYHSGR